MVLWKSFALFLVVALPTAFSRKTGPPFGFPALPGFQVSTTSQVVSRNATLLPPYNTTFYFDQLIDHNNPSLGTFKQRYWHTWEYYEPGGPIIIVTPGENNAETYWPYITNQSINGLIAEQENGAAIVLEHRFFGLSDPGPDLSVQNLKLLTVQQAIDDFEYFAKSVVLPMPGGDQVTPDKAPWVVLGASYSGALAAYAIVNKPGLFAAGYLSSSVVEAQINYWQYFEPIRQYMPQNCSADVQAVITYFDGIVTADNTTAIDAFKTSFGLQDLDHIDDVAGALKANLFDWQSLQPSTGPGALFYQFCDALEVKNGVNAPESGWGAEHAVQAWSQFFSETYISLYCGDESISDCFGTYDLNSPYYTDISVSNNVRAWNWLACNEFGFFQESAPADHPTLVSRTLNITYDQRVCQFMFSEAFPTLPTPNANKTNSLYGGWDLQVNNVFFVNGLRDPWRDVTLSADGQNFPSTPSRPIALDDAFHASDLRVVNAEADPTVQAAQTQALASMKTWLAIWNLKKRDMTA